MQLGTNLRSNQLHEHGMPNYWAGDDTSEKFWWIIARSQAECKFKKKKKTTNLMVLQRKAVLVLETY